MCTAGQRVLLTITGPGPSFDILYIVSPSVNIKLLICLLLTIFTIIIFFFEAAVSSLRRKRMELLLPHLGAKVNAVVNISVKLSIFVQTRIRTRPSNHGVAYWLRRGWSDVVVVVWWEWCLNSRISKAGKGH